MYDLPIQTYICNVSSAKCAPHCRVLTRFELNYFANCSNVAEFPFNLAIKKLYTQLRVARKKRT